MSNSYQFFNVFETCEHETIERVEHRPDAGYWPREAACGWFYTLEVMRNRVCVCVSYKMRLPLLGRTCSLLSGRLFSTTAPGRNVGVFWDLDNLRPHEADAHGVAASVIAAAAARGSVVTCNAYANSRTLVVPPSPLYPASGHAIASGVTAAGFRMHRVPTLPQAADRALTATAEQWLASTPQPTLMILANDQGYRRLIRKAKRLGALVVVVSTWRWNIAAQAELLPWTSFHEAWEPPGWRGTKWYQELHLAS